jgi:hypothetical protein
MFRHVVGRLSLHQSRRMYGRSPIIDQFIEFYRGAPRLIESTAPPEATTRRMLDSFCEGHLPFRTDTRLRERYVNAFGALRCLFSGGIVTPGWAKSWRIWM